MVNDPVAVALSVAQILMVQGAALDQTYLRQRAARVGVSDLLARAVAAVDGT